MDNFKIRRNLKVKKLFYADIYNFSTHNRIFCSFIKDVKSTDKFYELADIILQKMKSFKMDIDLFVSVPKYNKDINDIDYSKKLAQYLSSNLQIPYDETAVTKIKNTKKLKSVELSDRAGEISSAFELNLKKIRKICIVDDVLSSGATVNELIKTFEKNNFFDISLAVLVVQNI